MKRFLNRLEWRHVLAWGLSLLWVMGLGWLAFLWKLGSIGLVDETEPLFAEAARQMLVTGDWITPYFNEVTRFDKPPLIYWLMAIAYQIFGVNEFAARLPSALSAIALMALGFYVLRRFAGSPDTEAPSDLAGSSNPVTPATASSIRLRRWLAAWIGAAAIGVNLQTIAWGRTGVSDMLLSGCMGTALLSFFVGYTQPHRPHIQARWYLAFYLLTAMAVLAKGPVGVVLPVLIIGVFLLYVGQFRQVLREMRILRGGLLFLAITVPWYVAVIWVNGQNYIDDFFGYHNFERFTSVVNHHAAPWYFYFVVVLVGFIPWSLYLPVAIARTGFWRRQHWQAQSRSSHLGLFALVWCAVIFGFFTIAVTKLPSYVLPLIPAAAILIALLWSEQMGRQRLSRGVWISSLVHIGFSLVLAVGIILSPNWVGPDPSMPNFTRLIQESGVLIWGSSIWIGVALVSLGCLIRRQGRWLWGMSLAAFMTFFVVSLMPAMTITDSIRQEALRQISETIVQIRHADEELVMIGFEKPSVVFYTQHPVTFLSSPDDAVARIRAQAHSTLATSALVLGHPEEIQELPLRPRQYEVVGEAGAYQVIRVTLPRHRQNQRRVTS